jgi:hypothetical protein
MFARRLVTRVSLAVLTLTAVACGRDTSGPDPAPSSPGAHAGTIPARVEDAALVELTACHRDGDTVAIEAVLTNDRRHAVLLQGVPYSVADARGTTIVDEDDSSGLWSSVTIGPGRQALLTTSAAIDDAAPGDVTCHLGDPDLRDAAPRPARDDVDADDVSLTGCTDDDVVRLANPHDEPVATAIVVEFFDDHGYSAGQLALGQAPTTYSDGREPGPFDVALSPGATGEYPISIGARVTEWRTPLAGPIVGCEVVAAAVTTDPPPGEVIVD